MNKLKGQICWSENDRSDITGFLKNMEAEKCLKDGCRRGSGFGPDKVLNKKSAFEAF